MTVKEMIIELLNYDMAEPIMISLGGEEKITEKITIEDWHGTPEIHFVDRREQEHIIINGSLLE